MRDDKLPNQHWLENMSIAAPIHALSMMVPDASGKLGIRPYMAPLGVYASWQTGRRMDERKLSKMDAVFNAGFLANALAHISEPHVRDAITKYTMNAPPSGNWSVGQDLARTVFGKKPLPQSIRNRYMTLMTLGLGLPLYLYYRQGLKPEDKYDYDPGSVR